MNEYRFNCFENFSCLMGDCKHSCCKDWKISIDKKTLKKYFTVKGALSPRLTDGIDRKLACFINLENGRCPFLNDKNLCDIIISLGKSYLSTTCDLHPKFRTFFKRRIETGYGASCEKACQLLLDFDGEVKPVFFGKKQTPLAKREIPLYDFRQSLLEIVYSKNLSFIDKINLLFAKCKVNFFKYSNITWQKLLSSLEFLDKNYPQKLQDITDFSLPIEDEFLEKYQNVLAYFIYRHSLKDLSLIDTYINSAFAIFCFIIVYNLFIREKDKSLSTLKETFRSFSAEIEYSEKNIFLICEQMESIISLI